MFDLRKTLMTAHEALAKANISHALIGGFALASYGFHRATADIDLLADGIMKEKIKSVLTESGFKLEHETNDVLHFSGLGRLDILLANRNLSQEMLKLAKINTELKVYILQPEDIIGLKIQAYSNDSERMLQDKADIQKLLTLENLDMNRIKKYADLFEQWSEIQKLQKGLSH